MGTPGTPDGSGTQLDLAAILQQIAMQEVGKSGFIYTGKMMGDMSVPRPALFAEGITTPVKVRVKTSDQLVSPEAHANDFYAKWEDPAWRDWLIRSSIASGFAPKNGNTYDYYKAWVNAGTLAAAAYAGGKKYTPEDVMNFYSAGKQDVGPVTTVRKDVSLTDPSTARALADAILQSALGRMPSDKEYQSLLNTLNDAQRANPTVTTQTVDTEGNVKSTSKGGINAQQLLTEKVRETTEGQAFSLDQGFRSALQVLANQLGG